MQNIIDLAIESGATQASVVEIRRIAFHPSLRVLCEMNSCGMYDESWCCPPGCGTVAKLSEKLSSYSTGIVYQLCSKLEDSLDTDNMSAAGKKFSMLSTALQIALAPLGAFVLGAGTCHVCEHCTYPQKPCRFPNGRTIPVEACGIDVAQLCKLADLNYTNGESTVTFTGLIALP